MDRRLSLYFWQTSVFALALSLALTACQQQRASEITPSAGDNTSLGYTPVPGGIVNSTSGPNSGQPLSPLLPQPGGSGPAGSNNGGANPLTASQQQTWASFLQNGIPSNNIAWSGFGPPTLPSNILDYLAPNYCSAAPYGINAPQYRQTYEYVQSLYQHVLGRFGEPAGVQGWIKALSNVYSMENRRQVALGFLNSQEFRTILIRMYIWHLLHRVAQQPDFDLWLGFLQSHSLEEFISYLAASDEFLRNTAGGSIQGFILALYVKILGRSPSEVSALKITLWVQFYIQKRDALGGNQFEARRQVVLAFLASNEFRDKFIAGLYALWLGEGVNAGILAAYEAFIEQNGLIAAMAQILASDDYLQRILNLWGRLDGLGVCN